MPRGDKSSYTDKQKRQAEHIEEGYEHRDIPEKEAERRAWATVNKETHGGKKSGSGRDTEEDHSPSRKGGPSALPPNGRGRPKRPPKPEGAVPPKDTHGRPPWASASKSFISSERSSLQIAWPWTPPAIGIEGTRLWHAYMCHLAATITG